MTKKNGDKITTVQALIDWLSTIKDKSKPLLFGGVDSGLEFSRVKDRGDKVDIEFNQIIGPNERGETVIFPLDPNELIDQENEPPDFEFEDLKPKKMLNRRTGKSE